MRQSNILQFFAPSPDQPSRNTDPPSDSLAWTNARQLRQRTLPEIVYQMPGQHALSNLRQQVKLLMTQKS